MNNQSKWNLEIFLLISSYDVFDVLLEEKIGSLDNMINGRKINIKQILKSLSQR